MLSNPSDLKILFVHFHFFFFFNKIKFTISLKKDYMYQVINICTTAKTFFWKSFREGISSDYFDSSPSIYV